MELEVREGNIAAIEADALANAANDHLWMGAGVAGALKRAGGAEIEREAVAKGPIPLGSAVATTAERVRKTTRACLELADELGCRSLALPAFGTGVGGLPLGECASAMVDEVRRFEPQSLERVIFAVLGDEARAVFSSALRGAAPSP